MLKNISLRAQLIGLTVLLILALVFNGLFGVVKVNTIAGEIKGVVEQDIPLTKIMTQITTHQLEQGVLFERLMRFGFNITASVSARKGFEESEHEF